MYEGGEIVYETNCYVCIALAIAKSRPIEIVMANAIPESKYILGGQTWAIDEQKKFCQKKS